MSSSPSEPPPAKAPALNSSLSRLKVLVVEDESHAREQLLSAVRALGHDCRSARDGVEAWAFLEHDRADVIICDWMVPGLDGLELCRRVRLPRQRGAYTYFILVADVEDKDHFIRAIDAGADDYYTVPIDIDELRARLATAMRVLQGYRELANHNALLRRDSQAAFRLARIDPLTRVANRLSMEEDLAALLQRAKRYGHQYSLAMCDIDLFKQYNDENGHVAGDDALRRVAKAMHEQLREGDAIYRYGGEEFVIILPEQRLVPASRAMNRVREAVQALGLRTRRGTGVLTISIGVAELDAAADQTVEQWIRRADAALYRAKAAGRNRVRIQSGHPSDA